MTDSLTTQELDTPAFVAAEYADELHTHLSALMVLERSPLMNQTRIRMHRNEARELIEALTKLLPTEEADAA